MVKIPLLSRRSATEPTRDENRDGQMDERDVPADDRSRTEPVVTDRDPDPTTYRSRAAVDRDGDGRADGDGGSPTPAVDTSTTPTVDGRRAGVKRLNGTNARRTAGTDTAGTGTASAGTYASGTRTDRDESDDLERTVDVAPGRDSRPVGTRVEETDHTDTRDTTPDRQPPVVPTEPRPRASLLATLGLIVGVAAALFAVSGALAGYGIALGVLATLLAFGGVSATRRRHVAGRSDALLALLLGLGAVLIGVLALSGQFDWPNTDSDTVVRLREWLDSQFVDRF